MDKISVIVPMYNAAKYLLRCLDSIAGQEYNNIEVLCIDDGSTDDTRIISERYAESDQRFKVYSIKHGGLSYARNYALERISGDWFAYVDADDWISPNYLKVLHRNAVEYACDVSVCMFQRKNRYEIDSCEEGKDIYFFTSAGESIQNYIGPEPSMNGMVWNKLYRAEKFKHIAFDNDIKVYEDIIYTFDVFEKCEKACLSTDKLYYWYYRKNSLCHSKSASMDFKPAYVFLELMDRTEKYNDKETELVLRKNFVNCAVDLMFASATLRKSEEADKVRMQCKEWEKDIWRMLNIKKKCKFILVIYMFWLLNFVR